MKREKKTKDNLKLQISILRSVYTVILYIECTKKKHSSPTQEFFFNKFFFNFISFHQHLYIIHVTNNPSFRFSFIHSFITTNQPTKQAASLYRNSFFFSIILSTKKNQKQKFVQFLFPSCKQQQQSIYQSSIKLLL